MCAQCWFVGCDLSIANQILKISLNAVTKKVKAFLYKMDKIYLYEVITLK